MPVGRTVVVGVVKYGEVDGQVLDKMREMGGGEDDLNYWGRLVPCD